MDGHPVSQIDSDLTLDQMVGRTSAPRRLVDQSCSRSPSTFVHQPNEAVCREVDPMVDPAA
jgi:hypothetical protein